MSIGLQIKKARENLGLTQEELGKKIGVTGVAVMRYERGQRQPRPAQIQAIADALGVPINLLYKEVPLPDALPPAQRRPLKVRVDKPVGIYAIRCNETGRIYIGLSTDIDGRLRNHLANLRTGKHPASLLQEDFDRYGEESLSLFVLEEGLTIEEARRKEQEYIAEYGTRNPANGYNTVHPNIRKNLDLIYAKPPKNAEILKNK